MESLNQTLFLWLNAPENPNTQVATLAIFLAVWLIWLVPALIGLAWLRGDERTRRSLLAATVAGLLALLLNQLIGLAWSHPRPFMIGLGHTLIPHVADSSFPSDHLTLWWAVAFSLLLQSTPRHAGVVLALLGLPMAWARIYLGVHFPFDMLGAMASAALGAWLSLLAQRWYLAGLYRLCTGLHRRIFGPLIRLGWVRD